MSDCRSAVIHVGFKHFCLWAIADLLLYVWVLSICACEWLQICCYTCGFLGILQFSLMFRLQLVWVLNGLCVFCALHIWVLKPSAWKCWQAHGFNWILVNTLENSKQEHWVSIPLPPWTSLSPIGRSYRYVYGLSIVSPSLSCSIIYNVSLSLSLCF